MNIFSTIVNAIFTKAAAAGSAVASAASAATAAVTGHSTTATATATANPRTTPKTREQVEEMIEKIADDTGRSEYNWDTSIVDLMKLLDLDSSLNARSQLAKEFGYTGALNGSAEMNTWLHAQVMQRLMEGREVA